MSPHTYARRYVRQTFFFFLALAWRWWVSVQRNSNVIWSCQVLQRLQHAAMVCGYRSKYLLHNYDWKRHNIAINNDCQSGTAPWKIVSRHVIRLIIFHKMAEVGDHQIPPSHHQLMYQYDRSPNLVRLENDSQKVLSPLWCNNNYEKIDKKESSSVWSFLQQCFAECFTGWGSCTFEAIKDQWRKGRMMPLAWGYF